MRGKIILLTLITIFTFSSAHTGSLDQMQLIGKGEAYYLKFIKVYDASLYTNSPLSTEDVLSGDVSKCLLLEYDLSLDREDFIQAADTILSRQLTKEQLEIVENELAILNLAYIDVKGGDTYTLCYNSNESRTTLSHNNRELVRIQSKEFARIYFSIWLGKKFPLDSNLRKSLLAKSTAKR